MIESVQHHWIAASTANEVEVQSARSTIFLRRSETISQKLQKAMVSMLDSRNLTEDILNTAMCLVEQTKNARPLRSVSDDPDDLEALTLLTGTSECRYPISRRCSEVDPLAKGFQEIASVRWYDLDAIVERISSSVEQKGQTEQAEHKTIESEWFAVDSRRVWQEITLQEWPNHRNLPC